MPIEAYIGRFVALKRTNRSYKGLCPFHNEKTPSFTVTPDKGIFHCFGCGKGGDLIQFVIEHDGVTFPEALQILARAAGIDTSELQKSEKRDPAYDVLMRAARIYREFLNSADGARYLNYLKGRGIGDEIAERFQLGASPDQWQFLIDRFSDDIPILERLSLARKSEKTGKLFDFFRDRVLFPIRDASGQVVGFGGRILPGSENPAKYMNSPESNVFQKSKILYGLFENMASIRRSRSAILTEGYLDVIGLTETGVDTAVAPLGTALTTNHVDQLRRYADHVTLLLDGDGAGREAARKGARMLIGQGFQSSRMFFLPTGMDPFDLSRKFEGAAITDFLAHSISTDSYLVFYTLFPDSLAHVFQRHSDPAKPAELTEGIRSLVEDLRFSEPPGLEEKKAALSRFQQFYRELDDPVIREFYAQEAARILSIDVSGLNAQLKAMEGPSSGAAQNRSAGGMPTVTPNSSREAGPSRNAATGPAVQRGAASDKSTQRMIQCERSILLQMLSHPSLLSAHLDELQQLDFVDPDSETLWRVLEDRFLSGEAWDSDVLVHSNLPTRVVSAFSGLLSAPGSVGQGATEATFKDLILHHRILKAKKKMSEIRGQMVVADKVEQSYLWERYSALLKESKNLEFQLRSHERPGKPENPSPQGKSGPEAEN